MSVRLQSETCLCTEQHISAAGHTSLLCVYPQVDILSNSAEVQEIADFVADNAKRLLTVESAKVLAVSSRLALEAKISSGSSAHGRHYGRMVHICDMTYETWWAQNAVTAVLRVGAMH